GHLFQVALNDSLEIFLSYLYYGQIRFFFADRREVGPEHIPDIADEIARHYGIEVDNADAFAISVEEHIADLGIVMGDPFFETGVGADVFIFGDQVLLGFEKFYQMFCAVDPTGKAVLQCIEEVAVAAGNVMETGQGIVQALGGEAGKHTRKSAELPGCFESLVGSPNDIDGHRVADKGENAVEAIGTRIYHRQTVGGHDRPGEYRLRVVVGKVLSHPFNVFGYKIGTGKDAVIQTLEDEIALIAANV